jgi:hypothetical protein
MASLNNTRLRRRLAALTLMAADAVRRRQMLRAKAQAHACIRAALARQREREPDIDESRISALRLVADAERELLSAGDSPRLQQADTAFAGSHPNFAPGTFLDAEAARLALSFAGRSPPDPGASVVDWYAWSLARLGAEPE